MFGTLRPALCRLPREDRQAYRRAYCGTCKALGDGYGQLARPLLSYDMVFLAAVVEATRGDASNTSSCRCPMLPVLQKPVIDPASPSVRIAAAAQVILASAWFDDQVSDGSAAYRPARALARPKAAKAHQDLAALGLNLDAARNIGMRQSQLETRTRNVRELAGPTSEVLASLMSQIPDMADSVSLDENAREALVQLGHGLGLAIYAVDALEDLRDDVERARFNPCIDESTRVNPAAVANTSETLREALAAIDDNLDKIPFARGEAGIRAAARGLAKRARAAIAACEEQQDEWALLRRRRAPERLLRALWLGLLWIPHWFLSMGRRVRRSARALTREPIDASACSNSHAFAAEGGSGHGSSPGAPMGSEGQPSRRKHGKRKKKKKRDSECCIDCCDCSCDCCGCMECCGDGCCDCCGDGDGDGCGCCDGDGCCDCDCGDCCSCDC